MSSKLCFLVGSGISLDSPSCQPTGFHFTEALLPRVVPAEKVGLVTALTNPESSGSVAEEYFLRFEQLLQHLLPFDPELRVLDAYGRCDRPNSSHLALASFVRARHGIFTTNFDNLLEYALAQLGVPADEIVPVIFEEDWRKPNNGRPCHVFKLHGSLVDFRTGYESRSSLQATIQQIARGRGESLQLPDWKLEPFSKALKEEDLVVLGYSGLDDFDVMPSLEGVDSARNVLWIAHDSQRTSIAATRIVVATSEIRDQRIDGYLRRLSTDARAKSKVVKIQIHTGTFLRWLTRRFLDVQFPEPGRCPESEVELPPGLRLTEAQKWFLAGDIYSYFNPGKALGMFELAIQEAGGSDQSFEARCHNYAGRQQEALMLRAKGEESLPQMKRARSSYERALRLLDPSNVDDRRERSTILNNLGTLHHHTGGEQNLAKAMRFLQQSLDYDDSPESLARTYNNFGAVEYSRGHLDAAVWYLRESCRLDREIGDLWALAVHSHNFGYLLCLKKDPGGVDLLKESQRISRQLGSVTGQVNCLHSLAQHYENGGDLEKAERHYEQAEALGKLAEKPLQDPLSLSRRRFRRRIGADSDAGG